LKTGIFIKAKVDGNWNSVDIGDPRLSDESLAMWLMLQEPESIKKVVMVLLGRNQDVVT